MAMNLRKQFGPHGTEPKPLLADDFVFSPGEYPSLHEFRVEHEEVDLLETPLAVDRRYFLSHGSDSLQIEFALCLQGFSAAVELLFQRASAFQREPTEAAVIDLARTSDVGDVGVAWSWGQDERDGVAGFVRHNVLVFLQGGGHETLLKHVRELDDALARQTTTEAYAQHRDVLFELGGASALLGVAPGGRADLGLPASPDAQHFFVASGGSVNRDPNAPARYYFRAGLKPGSHVIEAYRVGHGLLPARQTIHVTISKESPS